METSVLEGVRHGSTRSGARSADAVATASVRSGLLEVDGAIDQRAGPGEEGQDLGDASQGDAEDCCRAPLGRRHARDGERARRPGP